MPADRLSAGVWCLVLAAAASGCATQDDSGNPDELNGATPAVDIDQASDDQSTADDPRFLTSASTASYTALEAFHRSGQTFLTWPEDNAVSGESYNVYRSTSPISASNLGQAKKVAVIGEGSSTFTNEVNSGDPYMNHYIIQDATSPGVTGQQLPSGVGLFVNTTPETGPVTEYYAVTEVRGGVEQTLQTNMTLVSGLSEAKAMPRPVKVWYNGVKTLYTHWMDYAAWNPGFEGYAYNFWVGIPKEGNASALPLQMHLHAWGESWQRYWTSGDGYGSGSPYNFQTVWIEPDDNRNTWWYGFANNVSRGQAANTSSKIVNYTEQRLLYYMAWITSSSSPYKIDTDRMYLYGGSMGGTGTLSFGLRHPELYSGLYAVVPATDEASSTWGRGGFDALWGPVSWNLPTNDAGGVHDRLDTQQYLRDHQGDDLPYTLTFHGRNDTTIEWSTQGLPWTQLHDTVLAPGPIMWANSDHSNSFDVYTRDLFKNYLMEKYALRKSEGFLIFSKGPGDDDPTGSIPSCRGSDPYAYGFRGNSVEYASSANPIMGYSAPTDTTSTWQTAIRQRTDQCNWPSSGTVNITLHRTKSFRPQVGAAVTWKTLTGSGAVLQSGTASRDSSGRLTLTGVQVDTTGRVLVLNTSSTGWVPASGGNTGGGGGGSTSPDADKDGVTVAQGDCNDGDASIYPGATEKCDGKDNNCNSQTDEGVTTTSYRDADADGYGSTTPTSSCSVASGYTTKSGDCDDSNAAVHPGATEQCNGVDDNCSGQIDEGLATTLWYRDADGDSYGGSSTTQACAKPAGYVARGGDCNDSSATVNPSATEVANGVDDNCNGQIDEGLGGGGSTGGTTTITLNAPAGIRDTLYRLSYEGNYGSATNLTTYNSSTPDYRALVWFDLSSVKLPAGAKVTSVQLKMYATSSNGAANQLYRVTRGWVEGTGGYGNTMNGATWKTYDGKNPWSAAGGDYDKTTNYGFGANGLVASVNVPTGAVTFDITRLGQEWLSAAVPNYGVMVTIPTSSYYVATWYASKESSTASQRPTLVIQYTY